MAVEDILKSYGIEDPEQLLSEAQQFRQFATRFQPGMQRQAFYTQQAPMMARYALQEPTYGGSFADFLGGMPGGPGTGFAGHTVTPMTSEQLRERAAGIGAFTGMTDPQFYQYMEDPTTYTGPGGAAAAAFTPGQMAGYRQAYLGSQQAGANVQNLVNLLALQRGGTEGRQYGGVMQSAITNMLNDLYDQYTAKSPLETPGNFLNWYLKRSAPGGRLAFGSPATTPAATQTTTPAATQAAILAAEDERIQRQAGFA